MADFPFFSLPFKPVILSFSFIPKTHFPFPSSLFLKIFSFSVSVFAMKFIKINPKRFSPKRLFRSKKNRSSVSRSDPSSFGSGTASSSSSSTSGTPISVLPETSTNWTDISADILNLELFEAFKVIDRDNDGVILRKELEALLYRVGADPPTREEVALMMEEVDGDGDGFISLEALTARVISACGPGPVCDSELRETFEFFDADHDGRITAEELHAVFRSMGDERCTLDDCRRMIEDVDENGDGFVCFTEFVRMMEPQR